MGGEERLTGLGDGKVGEVVGKRGGMEGMWTGTYAAEELASGIMWRRTLMSGDIACEIKLQAYKIRAL